MMRTLISAILALVIGLALSACDSPGDTVGPTPTLVSTPTPTPTSTPTPTPTSTLTPTPTPTSTSAPTPAPTSTPTPTPAPTSTPTPTPTPTSTPTSTPMEANFEVSVSEATLQLPDSISFHLEGRGQRPIELIDVEFGTDLVFSCASSEYWSARTDFEAGRDVAVTWDWDMRRRGSIPPGAVVWWRWRVVDDTGQEFRTPSQETVFSDDRFDWQAHTADNVTFNWYAGGSDFGSRIADGVRDSLDTLQLGKELVAPIKVFVYESAADARGAVLFAQAWTGGLAFVAHNIVLITVDPEDFESHLPGVVHELAHLLVEEATFNCFGGLPTWLDEGLAVYAEGELPDYQRRALDEAIANDDLISLRSLNSSFPAADTGATLSYALSQSLVEYLITAHGWPKMQELLAVFAQGTTHEGAIQQVYGMDLDGLEAAWRQSLGLP